MNEYEKQALDFCEKYGVEISFTYLGKQKREVVFGDEIARDTYSVEINRDGKAFSVVFTDSLFNTEKNDSRRISRRKKQFPSEYDILACITKYDVGDFDDFIADFGYSFKTEREYIKIKQIYFNVVDEYRSVYKMFSDCMDELSEIC